MRRLVLVRHATTSAVRRAAFPADEPLDERGLAAASSLRGAVRGPASCGPSSRARATASALGFAEAVVDPRLDECDFGTWAGLALADVDADAMTAWMAGEAPHGGETQAAFRTRVGGWLDEQAALDGRLVAVTSGGVIKACVVHALGAPASAFWQVDAAPLHTTELHAHDGRWTVAHVNAPLVAKGTPSGAAVGGGSGTPSGAAAAAAEGRGPA